MRKPLIAGNWKMNGDMKTSYKLITELKEGILNSDVETLICCPFTLINEVSTLIKGSNIKLGAQNMHWENKGAYTGEISADMLKELDVEYVILGHSERREIFLETDSIVNKKVLKALEKNIKPILCVGETLEEREKKQTKDKIKEQVLRALENVDENEIINVVIAYEPIWAIGTGKTATPVEANEVVGFIREILENKYGVDISEEIRILYGGSVKPENATEILNKQDIDGALVGGASLKANDFISIINF
ncbi:triose-phosphate isomerase [Serpentinicella sp. ANB-PHB4]|uniref:triose-phosphate isomerase n=1 Tax=Serpentinicella sp. ANB-PHB4 TaxID=3074076 RepID=UPI0028550DA5|nr:triose-phosphate isomerase [Serpentinicella sp. ANB-PHB4]MDR5658971.1 triose-phosphate isomerase [Serpentinicella sp. ANB-PHB4]